MCRTADLIIVGELGNGTTIGPSRVVVKAGGFKYF